MRNQNHQAVRWCFNTHFFMGFAVLIFIEIFIAIFVHDRFVRPFLGDLIAAVVVYAFIKSFLDIGILSAALFSLLFSYFIEALQYFNFLEKVNWQDHKLLRIVLGSSFDWGDIWAYTAGVLLIVCWNLSKLKTQGFYAR